MIAQAKSNDPLTPRTPTPAQQHHVVADRQVASVSSSQPAPKTALRVEAEARDKMLHTQLLFSKTHHSDSDDDLDEALEHRTIRNHVLNPDHVPRRRVNVAMSQPVCNESGFSAPFTPMTARKSTTTLPTPPKTPAAVLKPLKSSKSPASSSSASSSLSSKKATPVEDRAMKVEFLGVKSKDAVWLSALDLSTIENFQNRVSKEVDFDEKHDTLMFKNAKFTKAPYSPITSMLQLERAVVKCKNGHMRLKVVVGDVVSISDSTLIRASANIDVEKTCCSRADTGG